MPETIRKGSWAWWCGGKTPRDRRNAVRVLWSTGAWAVSFVGGSELIRREIVPTGWISWLLASVPTVIAVLALLAYGRFLREADELSRKIHLQALALGFGGGWFAIAGYRVFELLGAPRVDRGTVVLVMAALYSIGIVLARLRYS
jgi:hypothetical protein